MICRYCKAKIDENDAICQTCGYSPFVADVEQSFTNKLYEKTPFSRIVLPYIIFAAIMSPLLVFYAIFTLAFGNNPDILMSGYLILISISIIAAIICGILMQVSHSKKLKAKGVKVTPGKVVDFIQRSGVGQRYYPIVEFEVAGKKYRYVDNRDIDHMPKIGAKFDIAYHSHNPHNCFRAKDNRGVTLIVTVLIVVAVVGAIYFIVQNALSIR